MLTIKLKNLENTKEGILSSIASLLSSYSESVSMVVHNEGVIKIVLEDVSVVEIEDDLVTSHSSKLQIKVTERIALGRLTDALQFVVSEIITVKDQLTDEDNEKYLDYIMEDWSWD